MAHKFDDFIIFEKLLMSAKTKIGISPYSRGGRYGLEKSEYNKNSSTPPKYQVRYVTWKK